MKRSILLASLLVSLSGCDQYANNATGTTKINEITVYGNIRCVLVVQGSSNTISCDWNHPDNGAPK